METINIISAIVGPILGALFAWTFARREAKVSATLNVITKTFEDSQAIVDLSMSLYQFVSAPPSIIVGDSIITHYNIVAQERQKCRATLLADAMALRLLHGDKASTVETAIHTLISSAGQVYEGVDPQNRIPPQEQQARMKEAIEILSQQINNIYNAMLTLKMSANMDEL